MKTTRHIASKLARQLLARTISFEQFLMEYPDNTGDSNIDLLLHLIQHQLTLGGFLGIIRETYDSYSLEILKLIEVLEE